MWAWPPGPRTPEGEWNLPGKSVHVSGFAFDGLFKLYFLYPFQHTFVVFLCILTPVTIPCMSVHLNLFSLNQKGCDGSLLLLCHDKGLGVCSLLMWLLVEAPATPGNLLESFFSITSAQASSSLHTSWLEPFSLPTKMLRCVFCNIWQISCLVNNDWWVTWTLFSTLWPSEMHSCAFYILTQWRPTKKTSCWDTMSLLIEVLLYCVFVSNLTVGCLVSFKLDC